MKEISMMECIKVKFEEIVKKNDLMDEIARIYEEEFNVKIEYSYAGSAQNLSQIELMQEGDTSCFTLFQHVDRRPETGYGIRINYNYGFHSVPAHF